MLFTPNELDKIAKLIDTNILNFIAQNVGLFGLTESDKRLLSSQGIDISKYKKELPILNLAYQMGMYMVNTNAYGKENLTLDKFKQIVQSNKFLPLSEREQEALNSVTFDATRYFKNLADKIKNQSENIITQLEKEKKADFEAAVQNKAKQAIIKRQTIKEFASELYHATPKIAMDLNRVAQFTLHSAFDNGRAMELKRVYGEETKVYKRVYAGACEHCLKLYLESGFGSKPIFFTVSELEGNGTNIGVKVKDWKPVIGSTHPNCRCTLEKVPSFSQWNNETKKFELEKLENAKEKIKQEEQRLLDLQKQRGGELINTKDLRNMLIYSPAKKGLSITNGIKKENKAQMDNELIQSPFYAVREFEELFLKELIVTIGNTLESVSKELNKL